ncbi:MAG: hypothetical protein CMO80_00580 [Verrucomicrobiales bacterium]|nr:hypothetical protein [Verrucomicrobiales bacterium]|tara:strand:+ start:200 stop:535 length:336 start_codon:yes stop_codon:yes gene_type:complete
MHMNALLLTILLTTIAVPPSHAGNKKKKVKTTSTSLLSITGMKCEGCAAGLKIELDDLSGVTRTKIDFEKKLVRIFYNTNHVTLAKLIEFIEQEDAYKAKVVPAKAPKPKD